MPRGHPLAKGANNNGDCGGGVAVSGRVTMSGKADGGEERNEVLSAIASDKLTWWNARKQTIGLDSPSRGAPRVSVSAQPTEGDHQVLSTLSPPCHFA